MVAISKSLLRPFQLITRVLQWCSAVIVMGITSYFIHRGPRGQHIIYQEVIVRPSIPILLSYGFLHVQATMSVVFFLPAFLSPFMPKVVSGFVFFIDVIFSYLYASIPPLSIPYARQGYLFANTTSSWLTAFIFAAQDYNWLQCKIGRAHV